LSSYNQDTKKTIGTVMDFETLEQLAKQIGFDFYAKVNMDALIVRQEVRAMCSADRCSRYGKSWSCPPACGTPEVAERRMKTYRNGILVQTTMRLKDDFDMDGMKACEVLHKKRFRTLARQAKQLNTACMPMASGSCTICRKCTCPDRPCRYPDQMYPSMEAYGLWVSDVCIQSGLLYNHGPKTITYTACILI
jgi:predicted metal-binding protein